MRLRTLWLPIILLSLAGCGEEDGIQIEKGPFLFVNFEELKFSEQFYDGTYIGASSFDSLYIENRGDEPLEITEIVKAAPGEFIITLPEGLGAGTPIRLDTLKRAFIQAEFKPKQAKDYTGKLTIKSNAKNTPEKDITLSAKGVTPP